MGKGVAMFHVEQKKKGNLSAALRGGGWSVRLLTLRRR